MDHRGRDCHLALRAVLLVRGRYSGVLVRQDNCSPGVRSRCEGGDSLKLPRETRQPVVESRSTRALAVALAAHCGLSDGSGGMRHEVMWRTNVVLTNQIRHSQMVVSS